MKDPTRRKLHFGRAVLVGLCMLVPRAEASTPEPVTPKPAPVDSRALVAPFLTRPATTDSPKREDSPARIALGKLLFFDARLSRNHDISCNTCHDLANYGVDHKPVSTGHRGQKGTRNSPTVYNVAGYIAQFWDGRASTLEIQAEGPLFEGEEMAMPDDKHVLATLTSIPEYVKRFHQAFPGDKQPVTVAHLTQALAAFERQLTTRSRFDRFLAGEHTALSEQERRGLALFVTSGCATCHDGPTLGGNSFRKLGLSEPYPQSRDQGRYEATRDEADRMKFRVPTLLNVEKTAPYLHDGSVAELPSVVRLMARYELGQTLTDAQVEELVAFLHSLTGELPQRTIAPPELPKSSPSTPRPDPT